LIGYGLAGAGLHAHSFPVDPGLKAFWASSQPMKNAGAAHRIPPMSTSFPALKARYGTILPLTLVVTRPATAHMRRFVWPPSRRGDCCHVIDRRDRRQWRTRLTTPPGTRRRSRYSRIGWDGDFPDHAAFSTATCSTRAPRFERYRPMPKAGAWRESVDLEEGGGLLVDLGSHLVDGALRVIWVAGRRLRRSGRLPTRRGCAHDDTALPFFASGCTPISGWTLTARTLLGPGGHVGLVRHLAPTRSDPCGDGSLKGRACDRVIPVGAPGNRTAGIASTQEPLDGCPTLT